MNARSTAEVRAVLRSRTRALLTCSEPRSTWHDYCQALDRALDVNLGPVEPKAPDTERTARMPLTCLV